MYLNLIVRFLETFLPCARNFLVPARRCLYFADERTTYHKRSPFFGGFHTIEYGKNRIGRGARIFEPFTLGFPSRERMGEDDFPGTTIGEEAVLRSGGIIYCDVNIGNRFQCGHTILIRERTTIGENVAVGTATVIEGNCTIGNDVRIQSMVFVPTHTEIGNGVFIGPHAVLTNDRYPPTGKPQLKGPVLDDYAVIGANATILPGIHIGKGSAVAAGAVVTRDVPPGMIAIGVPARNTEMPEGMRRTGR